MYTEKQLQFTVASYMYQGLSNILGLIGLKSFRSFASLYNYEDCETNLGDKAYSQNPRKLNLTES